MSLIFQDLNPTAENIAVVIWNKLRVKMERFDLEVVLYETARNFVTIREDYNGITSRR
jgi:6-pyruvoyltetrahydropterin/6-carboxytetrahydropterin synthase